MPLLSTCEGGLPYFESKMTGVYIICNDRKGRKQHVGQRSAISSLVGPSPYLKACVWSLSCVILRASAGYLQASDLMLFRVSEDVLFSA